MATPFSGITNATGGAVTPNTLGDVLNFASGSSNTIITGGPTDDPLQLGNITLENFTAPEELPIGLASAFAVHDFPTADGQDGYREIQNFGLFYDPIRWTGLLIGEDAEDRSHKLEALMKRKQSNMLIWRGYRLRVHLAHYVARIRHRFEFEYEMEVIPISAQNAESTGPFNSPEPIVDHSFQQAAFALGGPTPPFELAPAYQQVKNLQDLIDQNLQQSNGKIGEIDPTIRLSLATQINTVALNLGALVQNSRPGISYRASDALTNLLVISNTLTAPEKAYKMVRYINPNLPIIASEEYGDPSLWKEIANAQNPKLLDQVLIGEYVLKIPLNPTRTSNKQPVY